MTDAELIARLRSALTLKDLGLCPVAADRIEALIAERNDWESHAIYNAEFVDLAVSYRNERDAARAKLAKAVEALENVHRFGVITHPALATLAEIKGESHD